MFKLGGRSGRNFLWIIFPPVFVILMIINYFKIAKAFGKPWPYGLGLRFVKVIFIPILAFDNSTYLGKKSVTKTATHLTRTVSKAPAKKVVVKKIIKKAPAKKAPVKKVKTLITKK